MNRLAATAITTAALALAFNLRPLEAEVFHDCGWFVDPAPVHANDNGNSCTNVVDSDSVGGAGSCHTGAPRIWNTFMACDGEFGCETSGVAICSNGTRHSYSFDCDGAQYGGQVRATSDFDGGECAFENGSTQSCNCDNQNGCSTWSGPL